MSDTQKTWTPQEILDGVPTWNDPQVRAFAQTIHVDSIGGPCDWCLTIAAHVVSACKSNRDDVRGLLVELTPPVVVQS